VTEVQVDEKNASNITKQRNLKNYSLASPQK